ncbi:uncharacterized protein TRIVIDRAFT_65910 [Trichoderma virens Gv29-8]|uniref:Uncharacterized protein n=1 Tax=Hypocrea virens (strain Gv29-8 / FGSC 10586) TaxID=413071 RepID=G9N7H8_HYPVG|nr:uncharacterized protein TRIVIDRAFT_65910 [Trichoderma virens Gv29-8]EHK16944.1 hypothetical protein TRIVIDRAFT_65910 [Trichoderma virens Gv29-8]UKZ55357.1 hypothetical protein TrVGV298_009179 [Trichoderma virens]
MDFSLSYQSGYLRDCNYGCYNVAHAGSQQKNPIFHHWEMTSPGYNYHFCVVHRVFHCMATASKIDQPCCGECAPAYYSGVPEVAWIRQNDYHFAFQSVQSGFMQMMISLSDRGDTRGYVSTGDQPDFQPSIMFVFPSDALEHGSALEAIPRQSASYTGLGSVTMAHRRQRGLILLRFTDYDGLTGWMLCGRNMTRESFAHLVEAEHNGDVVMKSARLWACQQLGGPMLQDIRWVVWTIYMISSKALANPLPTEREFWFWRAWLWYWYSKVNELAEIYHTTISSPEEDWFNRSPSDNHPVPHPSNDEAEVSAERHDTPAPPYQVDAPDVFFVSDEENEDNADSADHLKHSESPSTDLWSTESSSTETSSSGVPSSETAVHDSSLLMTGLATTLASIDEDEDAEADGDQ